jgi:uncharacterized protein
MSNRLPVEINPYRCIEQKRLIEGEIALNMLPRLKKILSSDINSTMNSAKVSLEFMRNESYLPMLKGRVSAVLSLCCQRCLSSVEYNIDNNLSLVLIATDTDNVQRQDGHETYFVENELIFLPDLIEDELMLALPISITHKQCDMVTPSTDVFFDSCDTDKNNKAVKENPFTVLKNLKG